MRFVWLAVAVIFIAVLTVLTALDIVHNGFNVLDVPAIVILALFATGLVGALLSPPPK
jgi:hypothetical protein